jgi:hypothetical protein
MTNSPQRCSAASEQDYLEDNIATLAHHLAQPGAFLCVHYDGAAKLLVDPGEVLKEASRRLSPEADPPQRSAATEGEIDFNDPLTSRIMGAARLHTHDHTMAYNITRDVLAVLDEPQAAREKGNRFCAHDDCPYPDCLVGGICPSQPSPMTRPHRGGAA